MRVRRKQRQPLLALAAAYALFLHALVTAFALGAAATAHSVDDPAQVICAVGKASAEAAPFDGSDQESDDAANCCGVQCGPCAPLFILAGQPQGADPLRSDRSRPSILPRDINLASENGHLPGNPRAPPLV